VRAKGGERSGLVGEWTAKFARGGGDLSLPKKHTFQSCGSPTLIPRFRYWDKCLGMQGDCNTSASPVGGEL